MNRKYGRNLSRRINHGYFYPNRSGSAEQSSLSEPDLSRNVKSLPESYSTGIRTSRE